MQAKLLRVLQESEFERVGGSRTIKVNVRVIATTNRDLKKEVESGVFREDLYYRLNVFPVKLPPLRERGDDIVEIAYHFLNFQSKKLGRKLDFAQSAINVISGYGWPGNVRELENVIERMAILEDGPMIEADAFPSDMIGSAGEFQSVTAPCSALPSLNIRDLEKNAILSALAQTDGNRTRASELLGFSVRTLRNKINENNIEFTN